MKIKENVDLSILEKYGFKKSKEWIKETKVSIYDSKGEDYYFFEPASEYDLDNEEVVKTSEDELAMGCIVINSITKTIYIDLVPDCTYHITDLDCPQVFNTLINLVQDGIVEV